MNKKLLLALVVAILAILSPQSLAEDVPPATNAADIFSESDREAISKNGQKFEFQAEVNRMMDILINSLYSNRDIFVREVISNAADALDKIRFLSLTDKNALGEGDLANLNIKIRFDKAKRTLTFTDNGVGMTKDDLIKNLGVLARSGTSEFIKAAQTNKDTLSLIGQFGVGFYSVYLAADKVTVTSKNNNDDQYIWESTADSTFTIAKDPRGNTLGRGTEITLYLKSDADEFLNEHTLTNIITKYSQFIDFPIILQVPKTITEEVEVASDEPAKTEDGVEITEEAPKKTEKVTREIIEDKRVNAVKAIWARSPSEVTDEEYNEFYKSLSKDYENPLKKLHFSAEGDINFKSILYIPKRAPHGLYERYYERPVALKLYSKRVLITDEWKDMIPRYFNFISGVVDADEIPLNVNREQLSQSKVLRTIAKKVQRKIFDMLKKLADEERKEVEDAAESKDSETPVVPKKEYTQFWKQFGKSIKLGVLEDHSNKAQLTKLLRFSSSTSDDLVSLEEYVERMGEGQKKIFYLTGESLESIKASPLLERAKAKGIEVLLLADPLDEYLVGSVTEFDGTPLQSLAKEGVELGGEKVNLLKKHNKDFAGLTSWLGTLYGNGVEKVVVSHRLASAPMVVVASQYGHSANMERLLKSQAFGDANLHGSKKVVEINPFHPIIKRLKDAVQTDSENTDNVDLAKLLLDSAMLQSGFSLDKFDDFASRVQRIVATSLGGAGEELEKEPEFDIEPEPEPEPEPASEDATSSTTSTNTDSTSGPTITVDVPSDTPVEVDTKDEL